MNYYGFELGGKQLKARLTTKAICNLEDKLGTNPINILLSANESKLPKLKDLLVIIHASLQSLEHNISINDVYDMWDEHLAKGGKLEDLINIVVGIFQSAGLLTNGESKETD